MITKKRRDLHIEMQNRAVQREEELELKREREIEDFQIEYDRIVDRNADPEEAY